MKIRTPETCYTIIWWYTIQKFDLSQCEILLITLVGGLSKKPGHCYASKKYIAHVLNVSVPTVYSAMEKLFEKGLLERGPKNNYGTKSIQPTQKWKNQVWHIQKTLDPDHIF